MRVHEQEPTCGLGFKVSHNPIFAYGATVRCDARPRTARTLAQVPRRNMQLDSEVTIDDIPRLSAETRRFTLGRPRSFTVAPDASRVIFVRARSGTDPVHQLLALDLQAGTERVVVDPRDLRGDDHEDLPPEEQARRERLGESGNGITAYVADDAVTQAVFALGGQPWVADLVGGGAKAVAAPGPVIDPRLDPTGRRVAYVHDRGLWLTDIGGEPVELLRAESDEVMYGLADFIAAEELGRIRGFWWSPDGESLLVQRTDESPVGTWWLSEPAEPWRAPVSARYPQAGTPNALVGAAIVTTAGSRVDAVWDTESHPYLVRAWWDAHGPVLAVSSRNQRSLVVLAVDATTGATTTITELTDDKWVEFLSGLPTRTPDGRLVSHVDDAASDTRLLTIDGVALPAPGLQLDSVVSVTDTAALAVVSADPVDSQLVIIGFDGSIEPVLDLPGPVLQGGAGAPDGLAVVTTFELGRTGATSVVVGLDEPIEITSLAVPYPVEPRVDILTLGPRELRIAVVLPTWWNAGDAPLPIIMAPYGGPTAQRVFAARGTYLKDQWLADQGFAIVICDGRGTPGRGPAWEKQVFGDLALGILDDQVEALELVLEHFQGALDGSRVGIHGWSFGGFLAALAVLDRPDRFHVAVAGAPTTDYRLYDTGYTERYLGTPQDNPEGYDAGSLLLRAHSLQRPLLIIHGFADDNVYAAHSLQLSRALFEAGKAHTFLPLSGESHRAPAVVVAENQERIVADFFRTHLL
jgi:dipeptidyl-peptidase-4